MTVDVEDWFHSLDTPATPALSEWSSLPSRVESNTNRLLEIFDSSDTSATFFFLGWIAEEYPALVRKCIVHGREVASHGYAHELLYRQSELQFRDDAERSRDLIEDAAGRPSVDIGQPVSH